MAPRAPLFHPDVATGLRSGAKHKRSVASEKGSMISLTLCVKVETPQELHSVPPKLFSETQTLGDQREKTTLKGETVKAEDENQCGQDMDASA